MANADYIGRYGDTLRKLHALDAGSTGAVQSAFSTGAPDTGTTPAFGPQSAPQQTPAFQPPVPHPEGSAPVDFASLWDKMPKEHKDQLMQQVQNSGVDVPAEHKNLVDTGQVQPSNKQKSKHDMLADLAEVALRTASNVGNPNRRGGSSFADYADAQLSVNEKNAALSRRDEDERRALGEHHRQQQLDVEKQQRDIAEKMTSSEGARQSIEGTNAADIASREKEGAASRQNAIDIEKMKAAAQRAEHKTHTITTDINGNMFSIDDQGNASPITTKAKVKSKDASGNTVETEVKKQLQSLPKQAKGQLDADTVLRAVDARLKILQSDSRLKSSLRKDGVKDIEGELRKRATSQVLEEAQKVQERNAPAGSNPYDQFDTEK